MTALRLKLLVTAMSASAVMYLVGMVCAPLIPEHRWAAWLALALLAVALVLVVVAGRLWRAVYDEDEASRDASPDPPGGEQP